jgi:hypothetical protein
MERFNISMRKYLKEVGELRSRPSSAWFEGKIWPGRANFRSEWSSAKRYQPQSCG